MNLFRNLKITHQFLILFGILIIGFTVIGLTYKQVLDVEKGSASLLQQVNAFGDLVYRMSGDVAAMNAEETNFQLTNDLQYAENFETLAGQTQQKIDRLEQTVPERKALGLVTQTREGLTAYEDAFTDLVDIRVLLGLDEKTGLHGEMRAAVHTIEDTVRGLGEQGLLVSMLQMRRHEKDFVQHGDPKYIRAMAEEQAAFADLLNNSPLPTEAKDSITREISAYEQAFTAFVEGSEQLEARSDDLQTALHVRFDAPAKR